MQSFICKFFHVQNNFISQFGQNERYGISHNHFRELREGPKIGVSIFTIKGQTVRYCL